MQSNICYKHIRRLKILILFLSLLPLSVFGQREDSTKFAGQKNPWIDILGLNYDNVETVETVTSDYWVEGNESKLFVYTKEDGIRYFKIFTPKGRNAKRTIKEKRLNRKQKEYYTQLLVNVRRNNFANIDKSQLNITGGKNVSGGTSFRLRYIGYDYFKDFYTYAPQRYVDNRLPGWQERVKLLSLIIDFNKKVKQ